jgi:EpsI family protein
MIGRRDLLMGVAAAGAFGASVALKPRRRTSLLGSEKVAGIVPLNFPGWQGRDVSDLVAPTAPDSLSARLYGEVVGRVYQPASGGAEVMVLFAHGDSQTDELQLHRPEVCYPAFGYAIQSNDPMQVRLGPAAAIPARRLVAKGADHQECILYWSRLGEYLPTTGSEQRLDQLKTAVAGYIADGLLARFSVIDNVHPDSAFAAMAGFIPALVRAVAPAHRAALIGTGLAARM